MPFERQSEVMREHRRFVENVRFGRASIQVITVHVVGSNNGLEPHGRHAAEEFFDRGRDRWRSSASTLLRLVDDQHGARHRPLQRRADNA